MMDLKRDYGHRGLQIVVKLANIELTPEKPMYEGGTWHVEGQLVCFLLDPAPLFSAAIRPVLLPLSGYSPPIAHMKLTTNRTSIFAQLPYIIFPTPISHPADSASGSNHPLMIPLI
jgi:hypothetical protein